MSKKVLCAFVLLSAVAMAPVQASAEDKMECTTAEMTKMKDKMGSMPASDSKTMAMKEMDMADKMMEKKDMSGCMDHMDKAMKAMDKK